MILNCLGSSSKGNCYILNASDGALIVECGISLTKVKKALNWRLDGVCGCLVSHRHKDHSKYLPDFIKNGIRVLALDDIFSAHDIHQHTFCLTLEPMHGYKVGGFKVLPFEISHDVPCLGFVIEHKDMGKLLFVTDTMMFNYNIKNLNHILLEANYCDDVLQYNIDNGSMPKTMRSRLLQSHMELQTAADIISRTDLSDVREIIMLHLSDRNSDEDVIQRKITEVSGKPVYIAKPGLQLDLSKTPY